MSWSDAIAMSIHRIVTALLLVAVLAGSGWAADRLVPLIVGWEYYFKVDWEAEDRAGRPIVSGHILNDWGYPARRIRLLVEGLDSSGQIVTQQVAWLGSDLTPGTLAYFEVPVGQRASVYRVSVFAFDWVQAGGGGGQR